MHVQMLGFYKCSETSLLTHHARADSPLAATKLQSAHPVCCCSPAHTTSASHWAQHCAVCTDRLHCHCEGWVMSGKYSAGCFRARGLNVSSKTAILFDAFMWKRLAKRMWPVKATR